MRILAAMFDVCGELGASNVVVANVVARAGISRRTFYELFTDIEDCLLAAFEYALELASERVRGAYEAERRWCDSIRSALYALLAFIQEDRLMGRLLVVESLASGQRVLRRRAQAVRALSSVVDQGRADARAGLDLPSLTAEGVVGGVLSLIHTRLVDDDKQALGELAAPLMGMIVLPYLGPAAARRELERPPLVSPPASPSAHTDPLLGLEMRLTYRTVRVLGAVAAQPGASNRDIGRAAGIEDPGQISKLLARLARLELIENRGMQAKGSPNAWKLTGKGSRFQSVVSMREGASSDG